MDKKYVTTQGFELRLPAQVFSTVTTTPLRISQIADNKKLSTGFACLPLDGASVQISLQSKNNIYKQGNLKVRVQVPLEFSKKI